MKFTWSLFLIIFGALIGVSGATVIFTDDFEDGPDAQWGNEVGNWQVSVGSYRALAPSTLPNAHSSLPFVLEDFSLTVDLSDIDDGGIWLRSTPTVDSIGREGVLAVFRGATVYFHDVSGGSCYGPTLGSASHGLGSGGSGTVTARVIDDTFSILINGDPLPVTSLTTANHPSGQVALYDFGDQTFDNVSLTNIPEPSSAILLGMACLTVFSWRCKPESS